MSFLAAIIKWLTDRIERVEFTRIDDGYGSWVIVETKDAADVLSTEGVDNQLTETTVYMTRHQFENLPEFNGF